MSPELTDIRMFIHVSTLWRRIAVGVALLVSNQSAFAADPPSAGGQFQQIPPPPIIEKAVPKIGIEQGHAPVVSASDHVKFLVKSLHLIGQTLYSEAKLVAITGFSPGGELTLSELRGMASKIADHYHRNGYFVAQAYLPAQEIKDGAVTITVSRAATARSRCTTRRTSPIMWQTVFLAA
jgi:hemolysin activation/secretion protein